MKSDAAIELRDVTKVFPSQRKTRQDVTAVHQVNLQIMSGEFFTLLGASGCGKTTTLRLIAGFTHPTGGEIFLNGQPIAAVPPYKRPVNTVFQNYALFPHMSVGDNIAFGLAINRIPKAERMKRVQAVLEMVRLPELMDARPHELSGGQQQRVALARALVNRPTVLLLDEPLSALDLKLRQAMRVELKTLQEELGITFIYVTHDQEEALAMSDRIAVMNAGRVVQVADPETIYNRPVNRFVADFIGETNFLPARITAVSPDRAALTLAQQTVWAAVDAPVDVGQPMTLAIRPEKVYVARPEKGNGRSTLLGQVQQVMYLGTDTRYAIRLDDGHTLVALARNLNGDGPLSLGEPVQVYWHETDARLLPE
ncbi:MAG: ABC transporter ATP-binding protein [Anaerolineales bacterium]|nr:ABC transporter ATP-binding protein [Anaerolineales bacterium]MCA9926980.1 ABC transporter ATP-binding protein [Anaerolineales bacterium]